MDICFADKGKLCSALTFKQCERHLDRKTKKFKYYECEFYKSQEQAKEDDKRTLKRLKSLDPKIRLGIGSMYKIEGLDDEV